MAKCAPPQKKTLIDLFAGVGGNAIAFALSGRWDRIFAVEKDPEVLACAKHNAEIYGVSKKIWWIEGDCFTTLNKRFKAMGKDAVLFASPPWGGKSNLKWLLDLVSNPHEGPDYAHDAVFDLSKMEPYDLTKLHKSFSAITPDFVLYLPRTSDLNQLAAFVGDDEKLPVIHYCTRQWSKVRDFSRYSMLVPY